MAEVKRLPDSWRQASAPLLFRLASLAAIAAAVFHGLSMFLPGVARLEYPPDYPAWRHVLFIGINLTLFWLFRTRPWWFVWAFGVLVVQILYGHGLGLIRIWRVEHRVDWISLVASIGAPLLLVMLVIDRRRLSVGIAIVAICATSIGHAQKEVDALDPAVSSIVSGGYGRLVHDRGTNTHMPPPAKARWTLTFGGLGELQFRALPK